MSDTVYTTLSNRILLKLQGVSKLNSVVAYPKLDFTSYPAAYVVPSQGESSYETISDDLRTYSFEIHILYPINKDGSITATALSALYDAVDDVLDNFAEDKQLNTNGALSLPTGKIIVGVVPVAAGWGVVDGKELIDASINISIRISIAN